MSSFSGRLKRTLLVALGMVVLAGAGGAWWYFSYYTNTPDYALKMVEESISKNDKNKFYKYVDVEHLLDTTGDALLEGLVDSTLPVSAENRYAVNSFTQMFKLPVTQSLQNAVDNYIEYGNWQDHSSKEIGANPVDADVVVAKAGIANIEFRSVDSVAVDADNGTAIVKLRIFQGEVGEEYVLDCEFVKSDDGHWQAYEIVNFKDFVAFVSDARKAHVQDYLDKSAQVVAAHEAAARAISDKMRSQMSTGSLGDISFRQDMKKLMTDEFIPEWESRKSELEAMEVPSAAASLHKLRIRICDANISYGEGYAQWLDDKSAATIRKAENSLRQAQTLEKEADHLIKQVQSHMK